MTRKYQSIIDSIYPGALLLFIAVLWQIVCELGLVPAFMLPSPVDVIKAFVNDFPLLISHARTSLTVSAIGLFYSVTVAFILGILMDRFEFLYKMLFPTVIITQTVPTIAVAPLLVLWMGYGMTPKIAVVFITCFFPVLIGFLTGLKSVNTSVLNLFRSMSANYFQVLTMVKIPYAMDGLFSGLRISATYAIVGAVIAEWLGGSSGLGVYMTRVRNAYAFDKMFAVIILITIISLIVVKLVDMAHDGLTKYKSK